MTGSYSRKCLLVLVALGCLSCGKKAPPPAPEVIAVKAAALPTDPLDPVWNRVSVHAANLLLQDLVEPRLMEASTPVVNVQALTDGSRIAFRLTWADPTRDDLPSVDRFSDGCAIQVPLEVLPDVPAPQMGEANRRVEISYWRAFWQSTVDGREDEITALYPQASIDHYPFQAAPLEEASDGQREMAARYAPARALGNDMAGPRSKAVEDLAAEGPGSLTPSPTGRSNGGGKRTETGWVVLISRPVPDHLRAGGRSQVAVAVWDGNHQEAGARKMRSGWIPLSLEAGK